jgi:uncharacterized membrane protein YhaH (DUF805 family)
MKGVGMTFGQAISSVFKKYASMQGRASRSEFWWFTLFAAILELPGSIYMNLGTPGNNLTQVVAGSAWVGIVGLALLIPHITVSVRRLHDSNRPGGWWWIQLVPFAGAIIFLVFMLLPGIESGNRFN